MCGPAGELMTFDPEALVGMTGPLRIEPDTIHVWSFALEGPPAFVDVCRGSLSSEERQRADRFVFARDRVYHTIAHGVLRHLLSRYCGLAPGSLDFDISAAGKPSLHARGATSAPLRFNLSHSNGRALLGVSDQELGIDLERVRSNIESLEISRHYFFGSEREAIERAAPVARDSLFFRYWVAKEAVLKAQGIGLGFPLERFRVDFLEGGSAARIETLDPLLLERDWTVRMLPCEAGWAGAVAARGEDWNVIFESSS
jgi:4'-phosphopantetheinyl transferase